MKTILTSKTILLLVGAVTLLATAGCVVEDRGRYHDHDRAVIVAPVPPAVIVRPPVVVVH